MTKQQKNQSIGYWVVFLVIAIPMACFYGVESTTWFFCCWAGLYLFVVFITWFLKKINWK